MPTIRDKSCISSATGYGKISFVSAEDVAAVAHHALVHKEPPNRDYVIVGPELLSHYEAAALFTEILGRQVRYNSISEGQAVEAFMNIGILEPYARKMGEGEFRASRDEYAVLNKVVAQVTGRPPVSLRRFIEKNKEVW